MHNSAAIRLKLEEYILTAMGDGEYTGEDVVKEVLYQLPVSFRRLAEPEMFPDAVRAMLNQIEKHRAKQKRRSAKTGMLKEFLVTEHTWAVSAENLRKPIRLMTKRDIRFVVSRYKADIAANANAMTEFRSLLRLLKDVPEGVTVEQAVQRKLVSKDDVESVFLHKEN